jgi:hypothetical protein
MEKINFDDADQLYTDGIAPLQIQILFGRSSTDLLREKNTMCRFTGKE